jgi:membrane protein DedA with SNARE-associated domain
VSEEWDIETIARLFEEYAERLPLELFVLIGSFVEEVISPIPSFVVMIPAGAAAQVQGVGWAYLLVLGLLGGLGRMVGSIVLYVLADKAEDWLFAKGRSFFGITHKQMERFGKRFSGRPRDFTALVLLNAVPVIPTALLSLTCGFIKINFRMFVLATFFGATVNAVFYMSIGYAGLQIVEQLSSLELTLQIMALLFFAALLGWFIYYRTKKRGR